MNELNLTPDDNHYGFAMQTANEIMKKGMGQFWEARKEIIEDLHNFREDQAKRSMDNALLLRNAISRMHQRRLRIEKLEKKDTPLGI